MNPIGDQEQALARVRIAASLVLTFNLVLATLAVSSISVARKKILNGENLPGTPDPTGQFLLDHQRLVLLAVVALFVVGLWLIFRCDRMRNIGLVTFLGSAALYAGTLGIRDKMHEPFARWSVIFLAACLA